MDQKPKSAVRGTAARGYCQSYRSQSPPVTGRWSNGNLTQIQQEQGENPEGCTDRETLILITMRMDRGLY